MRAREKLRAKRKLRMAPLAAAPLAVLFLFGGAGTQTMHLQGETLFPAFDGWERQDDGSIKLWFGYFNESWEQEFGGPEVRQVVWTLTANGKTQRVYASLSPKRPPPKQWRWPSRSSWLF